MQEDLKIVNSFSGKTKKFDLEERLIEFAVNIVSFVEKLPNTKPASHLGTQLLRSGTSPALNYGEAKSAESKNDFIHKMRVCLKELRESFICLKIIHHTNFLTSQTEVTSLIKEGDELIAIFVKSIETALKNKRIQS